MSKRRVDSPAEQERLTPHGIGRPLPSARMSRVFGEYAEFRETPAIQPISPVQMQIEESRDFVVIFLCLWRIQVEQVLHVRLPFPYLQDGLDTSRS